MTTAAVVDRARRAGLAVVLHESAGEPVSSLTVPEQGEVLLVVGPEGGLSDDEVAVLAGSGARVVRLGPSVLRASTAGAVGAAVLLSRTSRWRGVGPR